MAYIALIMTLIKILLDFSMFVVKKKNHKERQRVNSEGVGCKHLQKKGSENICTNSLFKKKMENGICPRTGCGGFISMDGNFDNDLEVISSPLLLSLKKIVDLFPEFAVALLALSELFHP